MKYASTKKERKKRAREPRAPPLLGLGFPRFGEPSCMWRAAACPLPPRRAAPRRPPLASPQRRAGGWCQCAVLRAPPRPVHIKSPPLTPRASPASPARAAIKRALSSAGRPCRGLGAVEINEADGDGDGHHHHQQQDSQRNSHSQSASVTRPRRERKQASNRRDATAPSSSVLACLSKRPRQRATGQA
jgi:hypothetical protein